MGAGVKPEIKIFDTIEAQNQATAAAIIKLIAHTLSDNTTFSLVLAGGNTPRQLYEVICAQHRRSVAWKKVRFYLGDERYVPHDHRQSNFRMIRESLLSKLPVPSENIFPMPINYTVIADAARAYESILRSHFNSDWPQFDLALLGLGADCHTASLFPGSPVLAEQTRWVAAATADKEPRQRLTLTLPAINHAKNIFFVVDGSEKAAAVKKALAADAEPICPAAMVRPESGLTTWWLDKMAAADLTMP